MSIKTQVWRIGILLLFFAVMASCTQKVAKDPPPKLHTVEIKEMQFEPGELWVRRGDTVVFVNNDLVTHNVTEVDNAWASVPLETGRSWRMVVADHQDYFCTIHPMMKGRLRVINNRMQ